MGVRNLWEVASPVARPVMLETLKNKRLAVDASIWIYQFLKAVRDSEGNVLKSAHVIGFFRRICKLLYFGIKPVFVFDGTAPVLKKQTLTRRRMRREGKIRDATETAAKKILAKQLQRLESTSKKKGKTAANNPVDLPENVVYYDERRSGPGVAGTSDLTKRRFKAEDQYHLPAAEVKQVLESDPRLMTDEELAEYAKEFGSQLSTGLYDTSLVDFESEEFAALPITTQYQMLNTARLRSRLRMGQTADQLQEMFPNRMDFSKFQIQRVAQRNYLTQRILGLVGLGEDLSRRVAGEKGREYVLKKGENGYTLALTSDPIDVDKDDIVKSEESDHHDHHDHHHHQDEEDEEDDDFEDVPLNSNLSPSAPVLSQPSRGKISMPNMAGSLVFNKNPSSDDEEMEIVVPANAVPRKAAHTPAGSSSILFTKAREPPKTGLEAFESLETKLQRKSLYQKQGSALDWGSSLLFGTAANDKRDTEQEKEEELDQVSGDQTSPRTGPLPPWFNKDSNVTEEREDTLEQGSDNEEPELISYGEAQRYLRRRRDSLVSSGSSSDDIEEVKVNVIKESKNDSTKVQDKQEPSLVDLADKKQEPLQDTVSPASVPRTFEGPVLSREVLSQELPQESETSQPQPSQEYSPVINMEEEIALAETLDPNEEELAEEDVRFQEQEDEELQESLMQEAKQNQEFVEQLNKNRPQIMSHEEYQREIRDLTLQQNKQTRDADEVTQTMVNECQELLRYFGIPYITAPMEAEAQCATLFELNLVDGIVTDDSDCFLFGGSMIYKNMFNQSKYVECYNAADLQQEFDLDRNKLIRLAHLLGSDYTDGLPGVGIVTALELLAEFNSKDGLREFKQWWEQVQTQKDSESTLCGTKFKKQFRKKFMAKLVLSDSFPSEQVTQAYLNPVVDKDATQFEWGQPDLDQLRTYLMSITGWMQEKVDELLVPVIQNINRQKQSGKSMIQTTISTLPARKQLEIKGSKRMRGAMESLISQADSRKKSKKDQQ